MTKKRGRPPAQFDLLGAPHGDPAVEALTATSAAPRRRASGKTAPHRKKPENPLQTDLFAGPLPPRPRLPRTHLEPEELRLSAVPASEFTPQAAPDSWLYLVTDADTASQFLAHGLPLRKAHPITLAERGGIRHWLMKITDESAGLFAEAPVVLRLRRAMVADLLEPDPDHSAEFSAPCYLLSGSRQEQDT